MHLTRSRPPRRQPERAESRPSWVHPVAAPDPYRGQHRGSDASRYVDPSGRGHDERAASEQGRPASSARPTRQRRRDAAPAGFLPRLRAVSASRGPVPSPTRSRSATAVPVNVLGLRARPGTRLSAWPRRWQRLSVGAVICRPGRQSAEPPRELLLLDRRQPGLVSDRPCRARHDPRRGPAGQRA